MTSTQAKPVDTYISEQHYEDCKYFLERYIPFDGCETEEEIEDKFNWWLAGHHMAVVTYYLLLPHRHSSLPLLIKEKPGNRIIEK